MLWRKAFAKAKIYANIFAIPVGLLVLWQALGSAGLLLEIILPAPTKVISAFFEMVNDGTLKKDLGASGTRVLIGCTWGLLIGVSLGILAGVSKIVERFVNPLVTILRQIPLYAWMPLIILWFGIGETSKQVIIAQMVFIPVFLNTLQGVRGVSVDYIEVANALELSKRKLLFKVVFPSALPSIFTGIRLGTGAAWMAVVASETLGGLRGLGYALMTARDFVRPDKLIATMVVIGAICDKAIRLIASVALGWQKNYEGGK
ncbi:MAG: ABC transporter permease [Lachnospiraceae bacterium]|jgi:sulfonate transport system permease protein|nr:ABC transporter permease [Lachnospiraceae bacterium]